MTHRCCAVAFRLLLGLGAFGLLAALVPGREKTVRPDINKPFQGPDIQEFLGKFEGESREIFSLRKEIVAACKLKPGMVVADVGAGTSTGLFTRLFAPKSAVAEQLHPSVKTVETYRDRICQKLDLSNGTKLAHYAAQRVLENG
jgi:hypothetical protein